MFLARTLIGAPVHSLVLAPVAAFQDPPIPRSDFAEIIWKLARYRFAHRICQKMAPVNSVSVEALRGSLSAVRRFREPGPGFLGQGAHGGL